MTTITAAKKPRLVRDNEVLIASLKELHPDNLAYVLRCVQQNVPVPDSTLFLARRLDDLMNEMKRVQAENLELLTRNMRLQLNATAERLENFWTEPGTHAAPVAQEPEPERKPRVRVLVYGLIPAQLAEIRDRLRGDVDRIDLQTEEQSEKTVKGQFDLIVCARFVTHAMEQRLRAEHNCRIVFERGGITSIVNMVRSEAGLVAA